MKKTQRYVSALWILGLVITVVLMGTLVGGCNKAAPQNAKSTQEKTMYHCPMHPTIISDKESNCPLCGMNLVPFTNTSPESGSQQSSQGAVHIDPVTVQNMGVTTELLEHRTLVKNIRAGATVNLDETRQAVVTTKTMGWIESLHANFTGEHVAHGDVLFEFFSPDIISAQEEYLSALKSAEKQDSMHADETDPLVQSTLRRLSYLDISDDQIALIAKKRSVGRTIPVYAPMSGIIIEKNIVVGQNVMSGTSLYKIADVSTVWVVANVYQNDIAFVSVHMLAAVEVQSAPGVSYQGIVSYISPILDAAAKTAQVRIEVKNTSDYALKPGMFATVTLQSKQPQPVLAVPEQAVIRTGLRSVVILDIGNGYYRPQEVTLGLSADGYVQILKGVTQGQKIVTSSQFLIDSESNLRAAVNAMSPSSLSDSAHTVDTVQKIPAVSLKTSKKSKDVWICTMDPQVKSDKPGDCPICGMRVVKKGS